MLNPEIEFTYEGKTYLVSPEAYKTNYIALPDKRVLHVRGWYESLPPKPMGFEEVDNDIRGGVFIAREVK